MQGPSLISAADSESHELESVQAALAKTPRLAHLLCYLAGHYFKGTTDRLTEFNIAVEVFKRNPATFIASEDAIARVETHRLRKKLKLFYETDGRQHAVQILIPLGTYVPVFTVQQGKKGTASESNHAIAPFDSSQEFKEIADMPVQAPTHLSQEALPLQRSDALPPASMRLRLPYAVAAAVLLLICVLGIYGAVHLPRMRTAAASGSGAISGVARVGTTRAALPTAGAPFVGVSIPFRMIAGYSGPPQKDAEGFLWQADQYYQRGWPLRRSSLFIRGASDPLIFQYGRAGDSDYDIPLKPGTYELHLYFMQASETTLDEDSEDKAIFNVALNGKLILENFDIVSDAMGRNTADERVFRDVSPAADGKLHLHISTVVGTPSLSAISIMEGTPGKLLPLRIATQATPRTDLNGVVWRPDNYFIGGRRLSHNFPSSGMAVADLLTTERYGHFTYALPVDQRDEYTISLYFIELFFGTPESTGGGVGSRVFRVIGNGNILLDNFDIFKEGGNFRVVKKTLYHVRPTAQGKLNLTFEPIRNYATVSAIEVTDESQ